jgi:hypothetical protein
MTDEPVSRIEMTQISVPFSFWEALGKRAAAISATHWMPWVSVRADVLDYKRSSGGPSQTQENFSGPALMPLERVAGR